MAKTIELTGLIQGGMRYRGRLLSDQERGLSIGTDVDCDWVIKDPTAAPRHAELVVLGDDVWICASSPLMLEGRSIQGWARLYGAAALCIGNTEMRIEFSGRGTGRLSPVTPTAITAEDFPPEAPTRVVNPSVILRTEPPTIALPNEPEAPKPQDRPSLSARFALPPDEVKPTSGGRAKLLVPGLLARRWAGVPTRWWMTLTTAGLGLLVGLTKPTIVTARAERGPAGATAPAPHTETIVPPATPPLSAVPAPEPATVTLLEAANALLRNDDVAAWKAYRILAVTDPQFVPFVNVLTMRVRRLCQQAHASPQDCEQLP